MRKILSLCILLNALTITAGAQSKDTSTTYYSLKQAIEYAYQHQKDVVNAGLDQEIAKAKVNETRGVGLPQVSGNFDVKDYLKWNFLFPGDFFPGGVPGSWIGMELKTPQYASSAGIQATQLLFDGEYLVGLQSTKAFMELSQKNLTRTKIETVVSVSKAYYNLLVNRQRFNLVVANETRLKKLKDDTKAMYDNGFVEKIDLDRVVLTYNNVVVEKQKTEKLITLSEYYLKFQMGMDINGKMILTDSLNATEIKNSTVSAEKNDATNRVEYSLLQTQLHLSQLDLKGKRAQYLPSLVLYGNVSTVAQRPDFSIFDSDKKWYPTGFVGATFTLPIFSGLQKHYRIDQAQLEIRKLKNEMESTANALNFELSSSKTALENATLTFSTQEKNLELANEVYSVSKLKYDQGVGSNLEVINAETSLKEAQTNYYGALYDALVAKVELDKASGNIK